MVVKCRNVSLYIKDLQTRFERARQGFAGSFEEILEAFGPQVIPCRAVNQYVMRRRKMKTIIAALAVSLALSACGGGGSGPTGSAPVAAPVPASSPAPASGPIPTGGFEGNLTGQSIQPFTQTFVKFGNYPFFGGALFSVDASFPDSTHVQMSMSMLPNWNGNILFKNNTTGISVVMSKATSPSGDTVWQAAINPPNLIRNGIADNFTVVLSD